MNKVKQAIADLRSYLGRDAVALSLLSKVERVANAVRVECAEEKIKTEGLSARLKLLEGKVAELEKSHVELKTSLQSANDKASQASASLRLLQSSMKSEGEAAFEKNDLRSFVNLRGILKSLQRDMPACPTPYRGSFQFKLSDLASDFRGSEAMRLGKFILLMTGSGLSDHVTIMRDWKADRASDNEKYEPIIMWCRTAFDQRDDSEILKGMK